MQQNHAGMPDCMTSEEIRKGTLEDKHINALAEPILCDWPSTKLRHKKKCNSTGHSRKR